MGNVFGGRAVVATSGEVTPLYGLGFSYAHRLPDEHVPGRTAASVRAAVASLDFDIVVFGGAIAGNPCAHSPTRLPPGACARLWRQVRRTYPPERIVVLDSADAPWGNVEDRVRIRRLAREVHYFVVNLPDECP